MPTDVLDTVVSAETPEGILLELRPAGLSARFYAFGLDWVIRLAIMYAAAIGCGVRRRHRRRASCSFCSLRSNGSIRSRSSLTASGATPGKRVFGLRVVMDNGLPITPAASLTRNLLRAADFLPFGYGFAIVSMLVRRDFKRLGDIAAATIVVHEPRAVPGIELSEVAPVVPARTAGAAGSGGGRRARRAGAQAHRRTARRTGGAGGDGVRRRGPLGTGCHTPRARRGAVGPGTTVMTPLRFEQIYQDEWTELEASLDCVLGRKLGKSAPARAFPALGSRRSTGAPASTSRWRVHARYPAYMVDRLERMTADAHQVIYQRREFRLAGLRDMIAVDFPSAVRTHASYVAVAAATFLLPAVVDCRSGVLAARIDPLCGQLGDGRHPSRTCTLTSADRRSAGRARRRPTG